MLTAVSGTLLASQIGSGVGTTAAGMELEVIAATIIGGTSLFGGTGRVWGTRRHCPIFAFEPSAACASRSGRRLDVSARECGPAASTA